MEEHLKIFNPGKSFREEVFEETEQLNQRLRETLRGVRDYREKTDEKLVKCWKYSSLLNDVDRQRLEAHMLLAMLKRENNIPVTVDEELREKNMREHLRCQTGPDLWGQNSFITKSHYLSLLGSLQLTPTDEKLRNDIQKKLNGLQRLIQKQSSLLKRPALQSMNGLDEDLEMTRSVILDIDAEIKQMEKVLIDARDDLSSKTNRSNLARYNLPSKARQPLTPQTRDRFERSKIGEDIINYESSMAADGSSTFRGQEILSRQEQQSSSRASKALKCTSQLTERNWSMLRPKWKEFVDRERCRQLRECKDVTFDVKWYAMLCS